MDERWLPLPVPQGRDFVTGEWAARLVRRVNALRVTFGRGFRVISRGPDGVRVECDAQAAADLAAARTPWTVRKHVTEDDEAGQWEIFLPGCMAVGETLQNLNAAASETSGHDDDADDWRAFALDEEEGEPTIDRTDGEGQDATRTVAREWEIVAHAKTLARLDGVDAIDKPARRYLYVSARKVPTQQESEAWTDEDRAKDCWGDEFAQAVARVEIGTVTRGGETSPYRRIVRLAREPISVAGRARSGFDLEWSFALDEDGRLEVKKVYCVRQNQAAAGMMLEGPEMTEVTGAEESIYARIDVNGAGENQLQVLMDPDNPTGGGDLVTWLKLYDISANRVKADWRAASLVNVQVFR